MPYTTIEDLEQAVRGPNRLIEITDFDNDGVADVDVIARAQAQADGWIDAHLRKFNAADLDALRANPTDTIRRIAADETIFALRSNSPAGLSEADIEMRKGRAEELKSLRADDIRAADTKTPRARFVENCGDVTKKNTGGMW